MKMNLVFLLFLARSSLARIPQLMGQENEKNVTEVSPHNETLPVGEVNVTEETVSPECTLHFHHMDGSPISKNSQKCIAASVTSPPLTQSTERTSPASQNTTSHSSTLPSEVGDLTGKTVYEGGQDVDEVGKGHHKDFRSKEEEKAHAEKEEEEIKKDSNKPPAELTSPPTVPQSTFEAETNSKVQTTAAAIAAGICLTLALGGYVGVLVWRRILQRRYGNSEELINEDDLGDPNDADLQHFELRLVARDQLGS